MEKIKLDFNYPLNKNICFAMIAFDVFAIVPYNESVNDIYSTCIETASNEIGVECERAEEQIFLDERNLESTHIKIKHADIVIVEVTNLNPIVLYGVGYAHGLNKKVILISEKINEIPFDLKYFSHVIYSNQEELKEILIDRIRFELNQHSKNLGNS